MGELMVYEAHQALAELKRGNYEVNSPLTGTTTVLKRDVDFGVIPKTKQPSLFKAGAEKICMAYGLMQRFSIESKIEQGGKEALFFYTVKCELVKIGQNGQEYIFASGYGSANTSEKRNGFNGAFDAANSTLKMAQKRALVQAALSVSGLSSMFSQDMENETFVENGYKDIAATQNENSKITAAQVKRLFAIANENGYNANEAKTKLASAGFTKASEVTQKDYDAICKSFEESPKEEKK